MQALLEHGEGMAMKLVAITSLVGGAGRTTLTANLACLLALRGQSVLAVELDAQNALGFLLGMESPPQHGLVALADFPARWQSVVEQPRFNLALLPSGMGDVSQRSHLRATLDADPHWLRRNLASLALPEDTLALIDTDRYPAAAARHAVAAADLVLVVVPLTPLAYLTVADISPNVAARVRFVANWAAAMHTLNNDMLNMLSGRLGNALLPCRIHRDEALPEAGAKGIPVTELAPESQSARDLDDLTTWLLGDLHNTTLSEKEGA